MGFCDEKNKGANTIMDYLDNHGIELSPMADIPNELPNEEVVYDKEEND